MFFPLSDPRASPRTARVLTDGLSRSAAPGRVRDPWIPVVVVAGRQGPIPRCLPVCTPEKTARRSSRWTNEAGLVQACGPRPLSSPPGFPRKAGTPADPHRTPGCASWATTETGIERPPALASVAHMVLVHPLRPENRQWFHANTLDSTWLPPDVQ